MPSKITWPLSLTCILALAACMPGTPVTADPSAQAPTTPQSAAAPAVQTPVTPAIPAAVTPAVPAAATPSVPGATGVMATTLTANVVFPAGSFISLQSSLRTQGIIPEKDLSRAELAKLKIEVDGRVLSPSEYEITGAEYDAQGQVILTIVFKNPPATPKPLKVSSPDGRITLMGKTTTDGTPAQVDPRSTAKSMLEQRLTGNLSDADRKKLEDAITKGIIDLMTSSENRRLDTDSGFNSLLERITTLGNSGKPMTDVDLNVAVTPPSKGGGGGGSATTFTVTSASLAGGAWPVAISGCGAHQHPALTLTNPPAGTLGYAWIMENTTASNVNWVAYNAPANQTTITQAGAYTATRGVNYATTQRYAGPTGVGTWTMTLTVYALNSATVNGDLTSLSTLAFHLKAVATMTAAQLRTAMDGRILAQSSVTGTLTTTAGDCV